MIVTTQCRMCDLLKSALPAFFVLLLISNTAFAQKTKNADSVAVKENHLKTGAKSVVVIDTANRHSPRRAMLYSTLLPGLGQAYNHKYWKIPLVYGAIGTPLGFFIYYYKQYQGFHNAYIASYHHSDSLNIAPEYQGYKQSELGAASDFYRYYRDLFGILTIAGYTLNILDAYVDGHLFNFNVNDDLGLHISPIAYPDMAYGNSRIGVSPGLSLQIHFKK